MLNNDISVKISNKKRWVILYERKVKKKKHKMYFKNKNIMFN